jgi:hypothetical protein
MFACAPALSNTYIGGCKVSFLDKVIHAVVVQRRIAAMALAGAPGMRHSLILSAKPFRNAAVKV